MLNYDPIELDSQVRESQHRRRLIDRANGTDVCWDYIVREGDHKRFVRAALVDSTKRRNRYPFVDEVLPDHPRVKSSMS